MRLMFLSLFICLPAFAKNEGHADARYKAVSAVMNKELGKATKEYQGKISVENLKIQRLKKTKAKILRQYRAAAKSEKQGLKIFERYINLVEVRYIDEEGEYAPRVQISTDDVKNINKMFKSYLRKTALTSTVSAEIAIATLEKGIDELQDMVDRHGDPDESNNSELQIIERKMEIAKKRKEIVISLVEKLGVKGINRSAVAKADPAKGVDTKLGH